MARKKSIIKDWISRDDDYVYRGDFRSGWQDAYQSTADYVLDGFVKPDTSEAEVREIHKLCSNRANILSDGKPIIFTINPDEKTAKTDGKKVTVGTAILDDSSKSFSEKADIMMGLTTHEMAHVLYSTFKHLNSVKSPIHKSILNVLEDERIEHILSDEFPGYASNLAKVKQYFFDEKYIVEDALKSEHDEDKIHAMELFDIFFKLVRYPKYLDLDKMSKYEMEIDEIKSILTPYPITAKGVFTASEEIHGIIQKSIEKKIKDSESKTETSKTYSEDTSGGGGSEEKYESHSEESTSETTEETTEKPSEPEESSDEEISKKLSEIESYIGDMMKDFDSDNDGKKKVEMSKSVEGIDFTKEFIYDPSAKATFRDGKSDKEDYQKYLSEVKGDANRLANSLFIRMFSEGQTLRGLRSGSLDESKIVEAIQGVKNVNFQKSQKQVNRINIVVLIDESGSMGHYSKNSDDSISFRYQDAAKSAIIIERAFEMFPAGQLFIYGFTGDNYWEGSSSSDYNQIIRYREPGFNVPYALGSVRGRSQNRDGHCIRAVAKRVREFTNEPMLFFIISDGSPHSTDYSGDSAIVDTRNAVKEVTKMRFFPVQIGIGGSHEEEQKLMFDDYVNYKSSRSMVDNLRKLIIQKSHKIFGI